jgi:hypothetical protein
VDDALRVGAAQRLEHLGHEPHALAHVKRPVARKRLLQRLAGDLPEDGVELSRLRLAGVDQLDEVRVRERGADLCLAAEALGLAAGGLLSALPLAQHLDRDRLARGELAGLVDAPEAAGAELAEDLVPILEAGSCRQAGRRGLQAHSCSPPALPLRPFYPKPGGAEALFIAWP